MSSTSGGGRREVELSVQSDLGGEMIGFQVLDGIVGELTGVGNANWGASATPVRSLVHWGDPDGSGLRLRVSLAPGATA